MMYRNSALAVLGVALAASPSIAQVFSESDFDPGSWTALPVFGGSPPQNNGEHYSVLTDRFIGNEGGLLVQQFDVEFPDGTGNTVFAMVKMNDWVYDPSTQGSIESLAASARTLPVVRDQHPHLGGIEMFILQDGKYFSAQPYGNFGLFHFDDDAEVRSFGGFIEDYFYEIVPDVGVDVLSHPDFSGGPMQFAFGLSLYHTGLQGEGELLIVGGFDDVSLRLTTVPTPGGVAVLSGAGLLALRRRRT